MNAYLGACGRRRNPNLVDPDPFFVYEPGLRPMVPGGVKPLETTGLRHCATTAGRT